MLRREREAKFLIIALSSSYRNPPMPYKTERGGKRARNGWGSKFSDTYGTLFAEKNLNVIKLSIL